MPTSRTFTRDQIRQVDRLAIEKFGMSGLVLMENAGRNAAEIIRQLGDGQHVVILCGKGNNGGDGYVIARHLDALDKTVRIVSCVDTSTLSGDAATNHSIAALAGIPIDTIESADALDSTLTRLLTSNDSVIDCLLGTGATGALRAPISSFTATANRCSCQRIAIDLPTGVDCDSGECDPNAFRADHTITFVGLKSGLLAESAKSHVGKLHIASIGVPRKLLAEF
jgi:NAD(P)H-hydrate epimerase